MEEQEMGRVIPNPLVPEIKRSYLDYAMSVIVGRALPDARDGLKPVQRRVLYGMLGLGIRHNQAYKKSARVVGEVMGKYHPHSDASIYDTMVRLAQPWNLRYPLVDGQGNFGSVDGDGAAAMRYTEARFAELGELMLQDIDEDTVDWGPNFDESLKEPLTLPSLVPNLLVNGSTGIAVGMATNMPPHNLGEVIDALCCLIDHPEAELGELMNYLPGPDFPTGGIIMGREGIVDAYRTGRGKIIVRGRCVVEEGKRRTSVVITEIPYMVNKTTLIEGIAKCVQEHTIDGVSDLRDESDRQGLRIVLDLNRDGDPELVQRQLYNRTLMQSTFGVINLTLVDQRPVELGLKSMLEVFLDYRRDVVRRRTAFRLAKAQEREHIIEGLCRALDMIDEVIRIIRGAQTAEEASHGLTEQLQFSEKQAQAILDMRLQRLTGLQREEIETEYNGLLKNIAWYKTILSDVNVLRGVIRDEIADIRKNYATPRRSDIVQEEARGFDAVDLIPDDEVVITLSRRGYMKRTGLANYQQQHRGGKGISALYTSEDDCVQDFLTTTNHQYLCLFTNKGRMYQLRVYQVPEGSRTAKGVHMNNLLPLSDGEWVTTVLAVRSFSEEKAFFFVTKNGMVKRSDATLYARNNKNGIIAVGLLEDDELVLVHPVREQDEAVIVTHKGYAIRFACSEVRSMGRSARGVKGISLRKGDHVVAAVFLKGGDTSTTIMSISENGYGKRTQSRLYKLQSRGGMGVINFRITNKTGDVVSAMPVTENDGLAMLTSNNKIVRIGVSEVSSTGRSTMGVKCVNLDGGARVVACDRIDNGGIVANSMDGGEDADTRGDRG